MNTGGSQQVMMVRKDSVIRRQKSEQMCQPISTMVSTVIVYIHMVLVHLTIFSVSLSVVLQLRFQTLSLCHKSLVGQMIMRISRCRGATVFLRGLFWGTAPAVKCAEKAAPNGIQFPPLDSRLPALVGDRCKHIQGAIVMSGSVEERPGAICQALRQALSDVLVQLTPTKITVSCDWAQVESEMTDDGIQIRCHEFCSSMAALVIEPGSHFNFNFTAHLLDPRDSLAALDALHLESSCAGAWRFLPALVDSLGHVRRLSACLEATLSADDKQAAIPNRNEI